MSTSQHQVLLDRLSRERMRSYLAACDADAARALALYEWNTAVSAALYEVLGDVEVVVRNALHVQLVTWYGNTKLPGNWFDGRCPFLATEALEEIDRVKVRLGKRGKPVTPADVVAELSFGFWRFILSKQYLTTLWPKVGIHAFPNLTDRNPRKLFDRMRRLHDLRNRIAHHEPIHTRRIDLDLADGLSVIGAVCATSEAWTRSRSRVWIVLNARPDHASQQSPADYYQRLT